MPSTTRIKTAPLVLPSINQNQNKVVKTYNENNNLIKEKIKIEKNKIVLDKNNSKSKIKGQNFINKRNKVGSAPNQINKKKKEDNNFNNIKQKQKVFKEIYQNQNQYKNEGQINQVTIETIKKLNDIFVNYQNIKYH